MVGLLGISLRL